MEYVGVFLATNMCVCVCVCLCALSESVQAVFKLMLIVFLILLKSAISLNVLTTAEWPLILPLLRRCDLKMLV